MPARQPRSTVGGHRQPPAARGWQVLASGPASGGQTTGADAPRPGRAAVLEALQQLDQPLVVVQTDAGPAVARGGGVVLSTGSRPPGALPVLAHVPALPPDALGDPTFLDTYGLRAAYVAGAMANGITSADLVIEMAKAGLIGFFGAAGLSTPVIRAAIDRIQGEIGDLPAGYNLIHSPADPRQEQETVDLYLERGVRTVSTSAYIDLTPMVVQYRMTGVHRGPDGRIVVPNRVLAKVSRPEVAERFLRPPPERILRRLVESGRLTAAEAELAGKVPMAEDLTAEADSGGHTDNRPLPVLLPLLQRLRDQVVAEEGYDRPIRVGAAGGLGDPTAVAGAFAMGAAYVLTGTVNQACVEAGTSDMVRQMLAEAGFADVGMAPSSDMFEAGVDVQVLKRGTLFPQRGRWLYELYRDHDGLDALPSDVRRKLEGQILRRSVDEVWAECEAYFQARDPAQLTRAAAEPRHKMALIFRWYLGLSSRWAIGGQADRRADVQVWCGPAIGAFNAWTAGTFLAEPAERRVVVVAANLMAGAAFLSRASMLRQQGIDPGPVQWVPRPLVPAPPVGASAPTRPVHAQLPL